MLFGMILCLLFVVTLGFFPGLEDPFLPARSIGLFACTALLFGKFAFDKNLSQRRQELGALFAILTLWLGLQFGMDAFRSSGASTSLGLSRDILLLCLCFIFYHLMRRESSFLYQFSWFNTLLAVNISGLGLAQMAGAHLPWFPKSGLDPENLTHINMVAQYLGFSLCLSLYLYSREADRLPRFILILASSLLLTYPLLIVCRSVLIGSCVLLAFAIITRRLSAKGALAIVFSTAFFSFLIAQPYFRLHQHSKSVLANSNPMTTEAVVLNQTFGSLEGKIYLWEQTLTMIRDQPWLGFGRGSFEQAATPYVMQSSSPFRSDKRLVTSPQNEILQLTSELGLPLTLALFSAVGWLLVRAWKTKKQLGDPEDTFLFALMLGTMLSVEFMFQFPLLHASGILFCSLFLASLLSLQTALAWPVFSLKLARGFCLSLTLLFFYQGFRLGFAEYISAHPQLAANRLRQACQLLPEHWRVCLRYSESLMANGQWELASQLNLDRLSKYPGFYPAEKIAALSAWKQGRTSDACHYAKRWTSYSTQTGGWHDLMQKCKSL